MSNKAVISKEKKPLSKIVKISFWTLAVIGLELSAVTAAVKIMEYRQNHSTSEYQGLREKISEHARKLTDLERLSVSVSTVSQQVSANSNALNLISDNLNTLKEEVGNNQIKTIYTQLSTAEHRLDALEEERSKETLILSIALMIKENVLYHRTFAEEAEILAQLGADIPQISQDIAIVLQYKEKEIANGDELIKAYKMMVKDFTFGSDVTPKSQEDTSFKKGINFLKSSASHIKLDKLVVLKKQKKTDVQIKLLNTLSTLVNDQKFAEALQYIQDNAEFGKITLPAFAQWQQSVRETIAFNQALSHIMNQQLQALRQDIEQGTINLPVLSPKIQEEPSIESPKTEKSDTSHMEDSDAEILK